MLLVKLLTTNLVTIKPQEVDAIPDHVRIIARCLAWLVHIYVATNALKSLKHFKRLLSTLRKAMQTVKFRKEPLSFMTIK